ncbi:MAG: polyprenyl synthetase family protein [Cyanobacteria bacterium]|nr:polyprenyl synthetase family protein [Cyanobacteriota bacterium]
MTLKATSSTAFDLKTYLDTRREAIEIALENFLPLGKPEILWDSMRYSSLSPGKRIRGLLCVAAYETIHLQARAESKMSQSNGVCASHLTDETSRDVGVIDQYIKDPYSSSSQEEWRAINIDEVLPCACALEMVHAMSLIHDDLPCLDNDDLRRGKPTNHKIYGEAMALLAGDALLMRAVEILISQTPGSVDRESLLDITRTLAEATGPDGMVGGQVFDLMYTGQIGDARETAVNGETSRLSLEVVEEIHKGKTAALIRFALWSGAKLAGATKQQLDAINEFGSLLGLAFQITDDLLDVTGEKEVLGKTPGKDEAAKKATWVAVFGLDGAREKLALLETEACSILSDAKLNPSDFPALAALLGLAIHRKK